MEIENKGNINSNTTILDDNSPIWMKKRDEGRKRRVEKQLKYSNEINQLKSKGIGEISENKIIKALESNDLNIENAFAELCSIKEKQGGRRQFKKEKEDKKTESKSKKKFSKEKKNTADKQLEKQKRKEEKDQKIIDEFLLKHPELKEKFSSTTTPSAGEISNTKNEEKVKIDIEKIKELKKEERQKKFQERIEKGEFKKREKKEKKGEETEENPKRKNERKPKEKKEKKEKIIKESTEEKAKRLETIREMIKNNLFTTIYLDGNNMLFVDDVIRKDCLNKKTREAELKLGKLSIEYAMKKNIPNIKLVFDNTKQVLQVQSEVVQLSVSSAYPEFESSDDAFVVWAGKMNAEDLEKTLFVTSDRELTLRLHSSKVKFVLKSGEYMKEVREVLGEEAYNKCL